MGLSLIIGSSLSLNIVLTTRWEMSRGTLSAAPRTLTFEDEVATEELRREAAEQCSPCIVPILAFLVEVSGQVRTLVDRARALRAESPGTDSSEEQLAGLRELRLHRWVTTRLRYLLPDRHRHAGCRGARDIVCTASDAEPGRHENAMDDLRQVVAAIAESSSLPAELSRRWPRSPGLSCGLIP